MISTPEDMWNTSQRLYSEVDTHQERIEVNLEFIGGALLSIAKSLDEINTRQHESELQ